MRLEEGVLAEIHSLRERVAGVTGVLVSWTDGLLIAHDTDGVEPASAAALAATTLGLGQRTAHSLLGDGDFFEAVTHSSCGYFVIYAAGESGVLAVIATDGTNIGRLHFEARRLTPRIAALIQGSIHEVR